MQYRTGLLAISLLAFWHSPLLAAPGTACSGQAISKTFASGASWNLCWTPRQAEGIVLSQVTYKAPNQAARRVLGEASLSQLETALDDGSVTPLFLTTEAGLGGTNLQTLTSNDCKDGTLHSADGRNVLCETTRSYGYLYKYTSQRQGQFLELSSLSQIGPRTYALRWRLYESGIIEPALGLSGELPVVDGTNSAYGWPAMASGKIATGFTDHALWRLDFDLDTNNANDVIEEITSTPTADRLRKTKTITTLSTETGRTFDPETKRFWRIRDGSVTNGGIGQISYELVPANYDQSRANSSNESWLAQDVFFTRYNACEKYAANNPTTACGANTSQFVNSESLNQQDVVAWYKQSYHHLPRSEDSNRISTVWSSFQLLPRDWHKQNPF
jgi:primary-amine oxidase